MGTNPRVGEIVKFGDKGISVEEARKKMLEAGQAPKGIQSETRKNEAVGVIRGVGGSTPVVQEPAVTEPVVAATEPVVIAPAPVIESPAQEDKVENAKFSARIFQEDGEWVAEIVYKNGAGTERFTAASKQALNLKLLEGKGNATLRVRESIRREKYGTELDKVYTLPDYMTQEAFDAMPALAQQGMIDTIATQAAFDLHQAHPEFYINEENSLKIQKFLNKRELPYTVRNMEYAYYELEESEELDSRPTPQLVAPSVIAPAPRVEDSAPAAAPATAPVSTVAAPAAPAVVTRKRGTTGLRPGDSSAANTELDQTEEGQKPSEPSEAELRKLPLSELQARARKTFKPRQF